MVKKYETYLVRIMFQVPGFTSWVQWGFHPSEIPLLIRIVQINDLLFNKASLSTSHVSRRLVVGISPALERFASGFQECDAPPCSLSRSQHDEGYSG